MNANIQLEGIGLTQQEFVGLLQHQNDNRLEESFFETIMTVVRDDDLLTHDMVQRILGNLDREQFQDEFTILENSVAQGTLLNRPQLIRSVYRFVDYAPNKELAVLLRMGLFLRSNLVGVVGFRNDHVQHIPRYRGHKCGLSCSTDPQFNFGLQVLGSRSLPFTKADMRREFGNEARAFLVYSLPQSQAIDSADWEVENDGANNDPTHVTVAPAREFDVEEPPDCLDKVRIPELEMLPWVLDGEGNPVLILKAQADWRDDFLPDRDEWASCVIVTMNKILQIGEVDDFVNVWRLHRMMSCDYCGSSLQDAKQDYNRVINFALLIISSYLDSDAHDSHDPDIVALSALKFLKQQL